MEDQIVDDTAKEVLGELSFVGRGIRLLAGTYEDTAQDKQQQPS